MNNTLIAQPTDRLPTRYAAHVVRRSLGLLFVAAAVAVPATRAEAAVTANVVATTLTVAGDGLDNQITVRVVAGDATRIEVLDGAAVVGSFVRATFTTISVDGAGGTDTILVSRANGNFTEVATLMGGAGNDTITSGNTNDILLGGDDNDTLVWNPGEGSDVIEGGNGTDTLQFNGANANEVFTESANGARVRLDRDIGAIAMDIGTTENLTLNMLGGDDSFSFHGQPRRAHHHAGQRRRRQRHHPRHQRHRHALGRARATTSSTVSRVTICSSATRTTTPFNGILATAATSSRAAQASTSSCSMAATATKS